MSRRENVSNMVSGLGMAMRLLQALTDEIVQQGGYSEMLHHLTGTGELPRSVRTKIVEIIVSAGWKVPLRVLEDLVWKEMYPGETADAIIHDSHFSWASWIDLTEKFGIPVITFGNVRGGNTDNPPVPEEIVDQIVDQLIHYPMIVKWQDEPHVVVNVVDVGWQEGMHSNSVLDLEDFKISLSPAHFFDLPAHMMK